MESIADLWWTVNDVHKEITFELYIKTTGWIALGIALGTTSYYIENMKKMESSTKSSDEINRI
jgi:hypothetical protein